MRLNKKEEKKNKKIANQQTVDTVHTHTHTGNNLNKRKRRVVCVVSLLLIVLILGLISYSENVKEIGIIENIKKALREITQSSNTFAQSNITTIDVTELVSGQEIAHECIYKTQYDKNNHWNQCIICDKKQNIEVHNYTTKWVSRK